MTIKDEIEEYLSSKKNTNRCFYKLSRESTEKGLTENNINDIEIFQNCGKKEGIEVWLIDHKEKNIISMVQNLSSINLELQKVNYIFLQTNKELLSNKKYNYKIYYWIGSHNIKDNFSVSFYTTMLSYYLNIQQIFREEKGNESKEFQQQFSDLFMNF